MADKLQTLRAEIRNLQRNMCVLLRPNCKVEWTAEALHEINRELLKAEKELEELCPANTPS